MDITASVNLEVSVVDVIVFFGMAVVALVVFIAVVVMEMRRLNNWFKRRRRVAELMVETPDRRATNRVGR